MTERIPSAPLRVLVVDDCPDTTASLAFLLKRWGHEVRVAHTGPEALRLAAGYRPDVVLLDLGLPGMDGHRVARQLRGELGLREALLLMLSGYGQETDRRRSLEAGCDLHWIKPVDPDELERLLARRQETLEPPDLSRTPPAPAVEAAEGRLRGNAYLALKNVSCECREGVLTLRGCLPSYHLKQVAQATVAGIEGVGRVCNEIEVVAPARRGS